ncbi:unnamed protein product, partial [Ixodes hexagonus]
TWQWPRADCIANNSCGQSRQSPINIETYSVVYDPHMAPLVFSGYDDDFLNFNVSSDGYTVTVEPSPEDPVRTVQGGAMSGVFAFNRMQFHWGSVSSHGSEHRIDGLTFAMESHLIHTNQKYAPADASNYPDGLAILATLYQVSEGDEESVRAVAAVVSRLSRRKLSRRLRLLARLMFRSQEHFPPPRIRLSNFLPKNTSMFYTYRGSLTMPPCSESVRWTVFDTPSQIKEAQV